jgi:hypothetical protein
MAYDKNKIYNQAKEAIEKHNLFFIEDIVAFIPCGRSWFYENFKDGTDEMGAGMYKGEKVSLQERKQHASEV